MSFYDDPKNAEDYIKMAKGYDGAELIEILHTYLRPQSSLLELGMGPGVDLDILAKRYQVTGSDSADYFLQRYKSAHPDADLLKLDAVAINTKRQFDCIYSNKVLHHLSGDELNKSFENQAQALNDSGLVFHSFWHGDEVMEMHGMVFHYRQVKDVTDRMAPHFNVIDAQIYTEMDKDDSFWVLAKKR
jgi:trans-aconitate methyltransferase